MADVKSANTRKQAQRDAASAQRVRTASLRAQTTGLNDMGELEQLRLQAMMDRRQKTFEAISNLMKKSADTTSNVISNLK